MSDIQVWARESDTYGSYYFFKEKGGRLEGVIVQVDKQEDPWLVDHVHVWENDIQFMLDHIQAAYKKLSNFGDHPYSTLWIRYWKGWKMDLWYRTDGKTTFYIFMGSGSWHDQREVLVFKRDGNGSIRGGRHSNEVSRAQIENNGCALLIDDHLKSILEELRENGGMDEILEAVDNNTLYWK